MKERIRNRKMRDQEGNQRGVFIAMLVAVVVVTFFAIQIIRIQRENEILDQNQQVLESNIASEEARKEELESKVGKGLTEDEIIKIARERFGLIFPNEIMFVPENK